MGWNSAGDIADPQIALMVKAVDNDELSEALACTMLENLIDKLQDGDWDTEGESLEQFAHVPWVVRAFREKGVTLSDPDIKVDKADVKRVVRQAIDANVDSWYDLSEDFARNVHADAITNAIAALFALDD